MPARSRGSLEVVRDESQQRGVGVGASTAAQREARLLEGSPSLTMRDLAERAGVTMHDARTFWRATGFADVSDDEVVFTDQDVRALSRVARLIESGRVDRRTATSLVRAQSYMADRLALWQFEALVEDAARRHQLDDTSARLVVLDHVAELGDWLEEDLAYAWRRQLAALAGRINTELAHRPLEDTTPGTLPLPRALGFFDMVAFTSRAADLGPQDLAALVQGFEFTARDVITSHGARVVKTIGDAVLYVADDLPTGARVAMAMLEAIRQRPDLPAVRGSLVWGRVVSRSGDVFGPVVNLAARLVDVAEPGRVVMDPDTAEWLAGDRSAEHFDQRRLPVTEIPGIGEITPVELHPEQRWWAENPT